jgi:hypothetical protein
MHFSTSSSSSSSSSAAAAAAANTHSADDRRISHQFKHNLQPLLFLLRPHMGKAGQQRRRLKQQVPISPCSAQRARRRLNFSNRSALMVLLRLSARRRMRTQGHLTAALPVMRITMLSCLRTSGLGLLPLHLISSSISIGFRPGEIQPLSFFTLCTTARISRPIF